MRRSRTPSRTHASRASQDVATAGTAWSPLDVDALRSFASVTRLHIVVIAALGALTFGWLFTGERTWTVAAIVAFDWLVFSLMNRSVDLKEDRVNGVPGVEFVSGFRTPIRVVTLALIGLSLGVFHPYEPTLTLTRGCFHLLGLFYNFPLLPGRVRLKQIYIVKNVAAALALVLGCFAYPLAKAGWGFFGLPIGIDGMTLLIALLFFFLLAISFDVISDLRDLRGDASSGIESLPVVLGPDLAITIVQQLLAFSAVTLIVGYATHFLPVRVLVLMAGPLVLLALFRPASKRGLGPSDPAIMSWVGVAMLGLYHLWIWLDLPGVLAM